MLRELDVNNFEDEIKGGLKLVEFYTSWCGYCKKQKPELEKMDKVWIGQVDADNNAEISSKYGVNAFPTFLVFKDGNEVGRMSGFRTKETLINELLGYMKQ